MRRCECVVIGVTQLAQAAKDYALLLQTEPYWLSNERCLFLLADCAIALQQTDTANNAIQQLQLSAIGHSNHPAFSSVDKQLSNVVNPPTASTLKMDMVVYMTEDINGCRTEFEKQPLALSPRKTITLGEQASELSFYDLQTLTLELAENKKLANSDDMFWGLGFRCEDIESYHAYLTSQGVSVSEIRKGMKLHTRVASIKSHHLNLPTLLVGPAE